MALILFINKGKCENAAIIKNPRNVVISLPFSRKFEAKVHVLLLEPFCMPNSAFMFKYFFEVKVKGLIHGVTFFFLLILRYVQIYCKMNVAWWKFGSGSGGKMAHFGGALNQTSTTTWGSADRPPCLAGHSAMPDLSPVNFFSALILNYT